MEIFSRNKTKTAGIINIVASSLYIVVSLLFTYAIFVTLAIALGASKSNGASAETDQLILFLSLMITNGLFRIVMAIVSIVLSSKTIKLSKTDALEYANKSKIVLAQIIINIFLFIYSITVFFLSRTLGSTMFVDFAVWAMFLISTILYILDYVKNKKDIAKIKQENQLLEQDDQVQEP